MSRVEPRWRLHLVQMVHLESRCFPTMSQPHSLSTEKEEVMGLCIELNDDLRSDPKFTYTRTEIHTVAKKFDTVRIVHIRSVIVLQRSDKRKG